MDDLKSWGFNLVRLGVMWEAVERTPGKYDEEYLQKINDLIMKLGERGIYTMVDAHQDVWSRTMCGEGMPAFYSEGSQVDHECEGLLLPFILKNFGVCKSIKDFHFHTDKNGWPLVEECTKNFFVEYYPTAESMSAFD